MPEGLCWGGREPGVWLRAVGAPPERSPLIISIFPESTVCLNLLSLTKKASHRPQRCAQPAALNGSLDKRVERHFLPMAFCDKLGALHPRT